MPSSRNVVALLACILGLYWYWVKPGGEIRTTLDSHYDYIVVGAGSAGCVVASRLSEDHSVTVLLLEAGDEETSMPSTAVPSLALSQIGSSADWKYRSTPQKHTSHGTYESRAALPRGKILGGSGSINAMMYSRGSPHDYDAWAEMGCEGWSYKDVLPYFIKSENSHLEESKQSDYHGKDGPLDLSENNHPVLDEAFLTAAQQLGHKVTDQNAQNQEGVMMHYNTMYRGKRASPATAFLRPAMERQNLHVATLALVTRILFDGTRAIGVEFIRNGTIQQVMARREVILSAGAYGSPHLLMLSGVGPREHIKSHNISVIADLPVGQGLQNHACSEAVQFKFDRKVSFNRADRASVWAKLQFLFEKGPISVFDSVATLYVRAPSQPTSHRYEYLQIVLTTMALGSGDEIIQNATRDSFLVDDKIYKELFVKANVKDGYSATFLLVLLHPGMHGTVTLASSDPRDPPVIDSNLLAHPRDAKVMIEGIREAQRFVNTSVFKSLGAEMVKRHHPSCKEHDYDTDAYWDCYIRHGFFSHLHHPCCTCRMGPAEDPRAVVDPQLRVHGISNLRVIDASIMPMVVSAPLNAASIMIGEKGADMVKKNKL